MRLSHVRLVAGATAAAVALAGVVWAPTVTAPAGAADDSSEVVATTVATRTLVDAAGDKTEVSAYDITLRVSETSNLRGRQEISVSWEGARPTGGTVADPNTASGRLQEYPFVLLQCRGVESPRKGQEGISPETCWTQTSSERYFTDDNVPPWRSDLYAAPADRAAIVGAPEKRADSCPKQFPPAERWLPFRAADGKVYYGGPAPISGCMGNPPEFDDVEGGGLPSNATYGITRPNGRGTSQFSVWTRTENASLGCSSEVRCALVAVPIVGISCDAYGTALPAAQRLDATRSAQADEACRTSDRYQPGESRGVEQPSPAAAGYLWWSESNWRNRITVPLNFAQTGDVCAVVSKDKPTALFGSVVLAELTASWQPRFCTDKSLFPFTHIQSADSAARNLLAIGEVEAALGTAPPLEPYSKPVAQAPVALGGFAIAYAVDDENRESTGSLRLNARLIAKLLSQSYPAVPSVRNNYPALSTNPMNMQLDPEFQALNPGLPKTAVFEAASTLQVLATDADLMWALTSYLNEDPEARAWLDGTPDPWGMTVNPTYAKVELPVESWPLLDNWPLDDPAALETMTSGGVNLCYNRSPAPYLALIANPTAYVSTISQNIQYAISAVRTRCQAEDASDVSQLGLKQQGRQQVGTRFVLGLVPLSATYRYGLKSAALQTSSSVPAGQRFTDAEGRTFVSGNDASLRAAAPLLEPDQSLGSWAFDYSALSKAEGKDAYPGTMPLFATVPTEGLEATEAERLGIFLCYAGTIGQTSGKANGQLPAGYLPLTADNGLEPLSSYTVRASRAVLAQEGEVPALSGPPGNCSLTRAALPAEPKPTKPPKEKPTAAPTAAPTSAPVGQAPVVPPPLVTVDSPAAAGEVPIAAPEVQLVATARDYSPLGNLGILAAMLLAFFAASAGALLRWASVLRPLVAEVVGRVRR